MQRDLVIVRCLQRHVLLFCSDSGSPLFILLRGCGFETLSENSARSKCLASICRSDSGSIIVSGDPERQLGSTPHLMCSIGHGFRRHLRGDNARSNPGRGHQVKAIYLEQSQSAALSTDYCCFRNPKVHHAPGSTLCR